MDYTSLKSLILQSCPRIVEYLEYKDWDDHDVRYPDDRLTNAKEKSNIVHMLEDDLRERGVKTEIAKIGHWFDIRIGEIPVTIKIANGEPDKIFNREAILYTLTGREPEQKDMTFNQFYNHLLEHRCGGEERNPMNEIHYLVFERDTGKFILRSLIDIEGFEPHPDDILQVCWKTELRRGEPIETKDLATSKLRIIDLCQKSVKELVDGSNIFLAADIWTEITLANLGLDPREAPACRNAFDRF